MAKEDKKIVIITYKTLNHTFTAHGHWANKSRQVLYYVCICTVPHVWRTKKGPCVNSLCFASKHKYSVFKVSSD